jgi:hypothetical protein
VSPSNAAVHRGAARALRRVSSHGAEPARSRDWRTPGGEAGRALRRGAGRARRRASFEGAAVRDEVVSAFRRVSGRGADRRGRDWHAPEGEANPALRRRASRAGRWVPPSGVAAGRGVVRVLRHRSSHGAEPARSKDWRTPEGEAGHVLRRGAGRAGRWVSPEGTAVRHGAASALRRVSGHGADRRGQKAGGRRKARRAACRKA